MSTNEEYKREKKEEIIEHKNQDVNNDIPYSPKSNDDLTKLKTNIHLIVEEKAQEQTLKEIGGKLDPFVKDCLHLFSGTWNVLQCVEGFSKDSDYKEEFKLLEEREDLHPIAFSEKKTNFTIRFHHFEFEQFAEPFFFSVQLFDLSTLEILSESFHFQMTNFLIVNQFFEDLDTQSSFLNSEPQPKAIFSLSEVNPNIYMLLRVKKFAQNAKIDQIIKNYKTTKDKQALIQKILEQCPFTDCLQHFMWSYTPLFTPEGKLLEGSNAFKYIYLAEKPNEIFNMIKIEGQKDGSLKKQKPLTGHMIYDVFNFSPVKFESELSTRMIFFEKRETSYLSYKSLNDGLEIVKKMNEKIIQDTKDKMENGSFVEIDTKSYLKYQMTEFIALPKKPYFTFVHDLYVYPELVNLYGIDTKNTKSKYVNVQLEVRLVQENNIKDEELSVFPDLFGHLTTSKSTCILYQNPIPNFSDEIKIKLPFPILDNQYLVFSFYHVPLEKDKKKANLEKSLIGVSLAPLKKVVESNTSSHFIVIYKQCPTPLSNGGNTQTYPPKSNHFKFSTRLISTIYPQEKIISNFFKDCSPFLNSIENSDVNKIGKSIHKVNKAILELKKTSVNKMIPHFTIILDFLFNILCRAPDILNIITDIEGKKENPQERKKRHSKLEAVIDKRRSSVNVDSKEVVKNEKRRSSVNIESGDVIKLTHTISNGGSARKSSVIDVRKEEPKSLVKRFSIFEPSREPKGPKPGDPDFDLKKFLMEEKRKSKTELFFNAIGSIFKSSTGPSDSEEKTEKPQEDEDILLDIIGMNQLIFDLQNNTFDLLIWMLKGACEYLDEFKRSNLLLASYVKYIFKDVILSKSFLYLILTERWIDLISKDNEQLKQEKKTQRLSLSNILQRNIKESNNLSINSLQFAWFLFDLIIKSYIINKPLDGGARYQGSLTSLIKILSEKVVEYSLDPRYYILSEYINIQVSSFLKSLSYEMKPAYIFEIMDSYLTTIQSKTNNWIQKSPQYKKDLDVNQLIIKLDFLKYLFDNDQIIALNNPDYFSNDYKESLICPPIKFFISLLHEYQNYIEFLLKEKEEEKKEEKKEELDDLHELQKRFKKTIDYITTKHKVDSRYQKKKSKEIVSRIYFPILYSYLKSKKEFNDSSFYYLITYICSGLNSEVIKEYFNLDLANQALEMAKKILEIENLEDKKLTFSGISNLIVFIFPLFKDTIFECKLTEHIDNCSNPLENYLYIFNLLVKKDTETLNQELVDLINIFAEKDFTKEYWRWIYGTILQAKTFGSQIYHYQNVMKTLDSKVKIPETSPVLFEKSTNMNIELDQNDEIKAATIDKLVENLFLRQQSYSKQFFLTYRSFTTPSILFDQLTQRYFKIINDINKIIDPNKKNDAIAFSLKILNMIKQWQEQYFFDFDNALIVRLIQFLNEIKTVSVSNQIKTKLELNLLEKKRDYSRMFSELPPPSILPKDKSKEIDLTKWDPMEIARQLTLIDYEIFSKIQPSECFGLKWTKKDKELYSPNIVKFTKRFNDLSYWLATTIVKEEDLKQRIKLVNHIIKIAQCCEENITIGDKNCSIHNFNAILAILGALGNAAVYRLKKTFEAIPKESKQKLEDLRALGSQTSNYSKLRAAYNCSPPLVPYLGLFLTDLTFIEEGTKNTTKNDLIVYTKRRQFADALLLIVQLQQVPFNFREVKELSSFLTDFKDFMDDEQLFKQSLKIEPRENKN